MKRILSFIFALALFSPFIVRLSPLMAQEDLQKGAEPFGGKKTFTTIKENPITSVKNQYRSGTCWDYGTIGFFESEILRKTGKVYDLCEMFVANRDYMDCAEHYVRMHGYSQFSQGGSCDDVLEVIRRYGICPENAMPAPGSLVGDVLANFKEFIPELEKMVSRIALKDAKTPMEHWQDSVLTIIEKYIGHCPDSFEYAGKTYTPQSFAQSLGLNLDDYVSLTSYTHHPFGQWFVIEALYKWRLKPSYNIPLEQLMDILDKALDAGYTVAWGGDVTGDFTRTGLAMLPDDVTPTQQLRQEQWDDWRFTYDHVMLIFGKAVDEQGKPYYMVKNSWGPQGDYKGIWYMSRDYMMLNTTYLFLNRNALQEAYELSDKLIRSNYFATLKP